MTKDHPSIWQMNAGGVSSDYLSELACISALSCRFGHGEITEEEYLENLAAPLRTYGEYFNNKGETELLAASNPESVAKLDELVERFNALEPQIKADITLQSRFGRKVACIIQDRIYGDYEFEFEGMAKFPTTINLYERTYDGHLEFLVRNDIVLLNECRLPDMVHKAVMKVLKERNAKKNESYVARELRKSCETYFARDQLESKELCEAHVLSDKSIVITGQYC